MLALGSQRIGASRWPSRLLTRVRKSEWRWLAIWPPIRFAVLSLQGLLDLDPSGSFVHALSGKKLKVGHKTSLITRTLFLKIEKCVKRCVTFWLEL